MYENPLLRPTQDIDAKRKWFKGEFSHIDWVGWNKACVAEFDMMAEGRQKAHAVPKPQAATKRRATPKPQAPAKRQERQAAPNPRARAKRLAAPTSQEVINHAGPSKPRAAPKPDPASKAQPVTNPQPALELNPRGSAVAKGTVPRKQSMARRTKIARAANTRTAGAVADSMATSPAATGVKRKRQATSEPKLTQETPQRKQGARR